MKNITLLTLFLTIPSLVFSQIETPVQLIKGNIIDKDTKQPLIGASVIISDSDNSRGTVTDFNGDFRLENVPVGRHKIICQYLGYGDYVSDNVILNSVKVLELNIEMSEAGVVGDEVVVTALSHSSEPLNELSVVSTRSFSVDETQRYAASANDIGRMAQSFPGVQPSRDNRSDMVIRGNSGIGLLWRLEGIDIPNPHHFARRGSSGGGITIFSVSMLGNSDFSTGAFPAEYGNSFSGVVDVHFRKGNKEKKEYSFRAGVLGLDFSTEGPLKSVNGSYLINYRYSTLGLLNQMGVYLVNPRTDNIFQDLSFNIHMSSKNNNSHFSIWGIGGLSDEIERTEDDLDEFSTFNDKSTRDFQTDMGALGLSHTYLINKKSFIKTSLAMMGQKVVFNNDTVSLDETKTLINEEKYEDVRQVMSTYYSQKLSSKLSGKVGAILNNIQYDLFHSDYTATIENNWIEERGITQLIQPYVQMKFRPSTRLSINAGIHAMYLTLNNTHSVEPRLSFKYQLSENSSLAMAYGLHSKMVPIGSYFTEPTNSNIQPNRNLELIKANHFVIAYDRFISDNLRFHVETYYQKLYDVPVSPMAGNSYSIINDVDGFATTELVSEGEGENIGVDFSMEKSFDNSTFFLVNASIFSSKYTDIDGETHNTRYNSNYATSLIGGKEWELKNNATLQLGFKFIYTGGARITPLRPGEDADGQEPPWDWSKPFEDQVSSYIRPDLRLAYRKNNKNFAWTLSLDIQNAINRINEDAIDRVYDPGVNGWVDRNQSGLTPILSFQIDW